MTSADRRADRAGRGAEAPDGGRGGDARRVALGSWSDRRFWPVLGVTALLGLVLRLWYVHQMQHTGVLGDGGGYVLQANYLAEGMGFVNPFNRAPSPHHPPLWIAAMAGFHLLGADSTFRYQIWASLVGAVTVVLVGLAGRRLAGARAGLIAAALAAGYAGMWVYERALLSETLLLAAIAVMILLAYRFHGHPSLIGALGLGALCGLTALIRAEQALLALLLVAPLVLGARTVELRRRLAWGAGAAAAMVVVISPWTVYNLNRFERPVLLSSAFGSALSQGNCDATYRGPKIGYFEFRCSLFNGDPDPTVADSEARAEALDYMGEHVGRLPVVVLAREGRTLSFFNPFQQTSFDASWQGTRLWVTRLALVEYWLLLVPAVAGALVLRRRGVPVYPLLAFVGTVVITAAITYGETRLRAALEVPLVLLAAVAVDALVRRLRPPRSTVEPGPEPALEARSGPASEPDRDLSPT